MIAPAVRSIFATPTGTVWRSASERALSLHEKWQGIALLFVASLQRPVIGRCEEVPPPVKYRE